jgi:hypothetical protein
MAHYAFLDENNIVTSVIPGRDEGELDIDWEEHYGKIQGQVCKRTSYSTSNNTHRNGGTPFRGNYATIGSKYLPEHDIFVEWPKRFPSWVLNLEKCIWEAPVSYPKGHDEYRWDEENQQWVFVQKDRFFMFNHPN